MAAIAAGVLGALVAARREPPQRWVVRLVGAAGAIGIGAVLSLEDLLWRRLGNGAMLLLTASATSLVIACHWAAMNGSQPSLPGTAWLRSSRFFSTPCEQALRARW